MAVRPRGEIKACVYAAMPAAYLAASDQGRLPAPARQVAYALRRLTGLGDALRMKSCLDNGARLDGRSMGYIAAYVAEHPEECADWDIVRDARGNFTEPHTYRTVPLGTMDVRSYLRYDGEIDPDDSAPQLSLDWWTHGPRDRFGAILYIEKEGFAEQLAADRVAERWDLAICSSKGYSVDAARHLLVTLAERHGCRVLVAHDFDKQGIGIVDLIDNEVETVDLGLRLDDVEDEQWGLLDQAESVTYDSDPTDNLVRRGATVREIEFLAGDGVEGQRVELNALVGRQFIDWLESKLEEAGVGKVIPEAETLEAAYRRAYRRALLNRAMADAQESAAQAAATAVVPDDLATRVAGALDENRERTWDDVVAEIAEGFTP